MEPSLNRESSTSPAFLPDQLVVDQLVKRRAVLKQVDTNINYRQCCLLSRDINMAGVGSRQHMYLGCSTTVVYLSSTEAHHISCAALFWCVIWPCKTWPIASFVIKRLGSRKSIKNIKYNLLSCPSSWGGYFYTRPL